MVYSDACSLIFENDLTIILAGILAVIYAGLYVLLHRPQEILVFLQVTISKLVITREIFKNLD